MKLEEYYYLDQEAGFQWHQSLRLTFIFLRMLLVLLS